MLSIRYSEIPPYLHRSGFYQALNSDNPEDEILIPAHSFKTDDEVNSIDDFAQLLRVMMYWVIFEIPVGIVAYCNNNYSSEWEQSFDEAVPEEAAIKQVLPSIFREDDQDEKNPIIRAMEMGRMDIVEYLASTGHFRLDGEVAATAARLGRRDFLMVLFWSGFTLDSRTCKEAAAGWHLDCLIYARENGCPWDSSTLVAAARAGHHADVGTAAAASGQLDCLEYALQHGCPHDEATVAAAVRHGHVDCLRFMHRRGIPLPANSCTLAAEFGQTESLRYARSIGSPWDETTVNAAVRNGHVDTLSFALDNGCPYDEDTLLLATKAGSRPCLEHLVECQGLYMSPALLVAALQKAELTFMQYLMDQGCPYQDAEDDNLLNHTFTFTDDQGLCDCIRYAVERGWRLSNEVMFHLLSQPLPECHAYLVDNGFASPLPPSASTHTSVIPAVPTSECTHTTLEEDVLTTEAPWSEEVETEPLSAPDVTFVAPDPVPDPDPDPVRSPSVPPRGLFLSREDSDSACRAGNIDVLHFLHEEGVEWAVSSMAAAAEGGHLGCVRFLHKVGCPWDETTTEAAARGRHLDVLSYALQCGCPCSDVAVLLAADSGSSPCLQLLMEHHGGAHIPDAHVFEAAFSHAHFDCVQYLVDLDYPAVSLEFTELHNPSITAVEMDNELVRCLVYIKSHGCDMHTDSDAWARLFEYVHAHKFTLCKAFALRVQWESKWRERAVSSSRTDLNACYREWTRACEQDCVDCVQALYDRRAPFDDHSATIAAESGHVHLLKHLHDYLRCLSEAAAHAAARGGQIETLRYLVSTDCPYSEEMMRLAAGASCNSLTCLKYLVDDMGIHLNEDGSVFGAAFLRADLPCVQYLLFEASCPFVNYHFVFDLDNPQEVVPQHKDAEFLACIRTSVECGWSFEASLVDYVYYFGFTHCKRYFMVRWWNISVANTVDTVRLYTSVVAAKYHRFEGS